MEHQDREDDMRAVCIYILALRCQQCSTKAQVSNKLVLGAFDTGGSTKLSSEVSTIMGHLNWVFHYLIHITCAARKAPSEPRSLRTRTFSAGNRGAIGQYTVNCQRR